MTMFLAPFAASDCAVSAARIAAACALVALVGACATRTPAPVEDRTAQPARPAPGGVAQPAPSPPAAAAGAPEPDWRPPTYVVKRGDTLHAIALDHGLDYRDLAAWNGLENANRIDVGQVLRLSPPGATAPANAAGGVTTAPLRSTPPVVAQSQAAPQTIAPPPAARNTDNYKAQPKLFKEPYSEQALRDAQRVAGLAPSAASPITASPPAPGGAASAPVAPEPPVAKAEPRSEPKAEPRSEPKAEPRSEPKAEPRSEPKADPRSETRSAAAGDDDRLQWAWPANGKVVAGFSETANLKGIDIGGAPGTPVLASAAGKVVYAGSGLRGYGKLIIVKHNATYLSAYAHNREILVKEGQQVARGQKIAEMGNTDTNDVKLHFEIRRLGKPVDPLKYLPPA